MDALGERYRVVMATMIKIMKLEGFPVRYSVEMWGLNGSVLCNVLNLITT
jgi:hypothetical protein